MSSVDITQPCLTFKPTMEIKDLKPGQSGWTHAWAVFKDLVGELWVRSGYSLYEKRSGSIGTQIRMEHDGSVTVDASHISSMDWSSTTGSPEPLVSHKEYIQVSSLIRQQI